MYIQCKNGRPSPQLKHLVRRFMVFKFGRQEERATSSYTPRVWSVCRGMPKIHAKRALTSPFPKLCTRFWRKIEPFNGQYTFDTTPFHRVFALEKGVWCIDRKRVSITEWLWRHVREEHVTKKSYRSVSMHYHLHTLVRQAVVKQITGWLRHLNADITPSFSWGYAV